MTDQELIPMVKVTEQDLQDYLFGTSTTLTDQQKKLFYGISLAYNLNPLKREIYAIKYGNNFNIITGYEVYLRRAERTGLLEWWDAGVKKEDNEYIGYCTIKRMDRTQPTTIEAWFNEYKQDTPIWKTKPRTMIRKVAINTPLSNTAGSVFNNEGCSLWIKGIMYDTIYYSGHVFRNPDN